MPHFDTFPTLYWLPVYALCWGLLWVSVKSVVGSRTYVLAAMLLLFLLRLPGIVFDNEINPDESQMITQALTLHHDPVYFRSVDGTTGGPLDSYFLVIPGLLGLPFDYITAHLTACSLVAVCLMLLFQTARLWFGDPAARVALLPLVFTLGLTRNGDFLHYNSELIALVLLSAGYLLYARLLNQRRPSVAMLAAVGLMLGMVPFGKLQAVPLAAVVGLFVGVDVLLRPALTLGEKGIRLAVLAVSATLFPVLVIVLTKANGVYDDFITFYIEGNFRYASNTSQVDSLLSLPRFLHRGTEFEWLVYFAGIVWIAGLFVGGRRERLPWQISGFIGVLLIATLFAITRTGSEYVHYLYFLTGPVLFGFAYGWQRLNVDGTSGRWIALGTTAFFLLIFGATTLQRYRIGEPINPYPSDGQGGWKVQPSAVSKVVQRYAKPGEPLVVWGWRCDYYVQTQMPQGVAENHSIRSAFAHPMLAEYQQRYVRDFRRSVPPVFVDAVGSQNLWMTDRRTQGHELIKPLGQFVAAHYSLVGLANDARIYVRNDRLRAVDGPTTGTKTAN
ncbi:hypothetical protein [Spirosoma rhododendri]|uniref:Glycosyltransferase RgtA/B/C/D-like domain-containing protein n=1 Tax=Spirosoma rhododendri TaxID=2728024 RepID=A0A7L5DMZ2_9BACT|nr:hypothetical protein [Spirosoma rhododendri]QJD78583.1 hypothetical protein HH216_09200 [Spirosoma rhododendri]